jgi:hypothetical protein
MATKPEVDDMRNQKANSDDKSKKKGNERSQQVEKHSDKKNTATKTQRRTASGSAKP